MGKTLSGDAATRAQAVIDIVSAWARGVSGQRWSDAPSGVPDDVRAVVLQASRRELTNPERFKTREMGPFKAGYGDPPDGMFYPGELSILRRFKGGSLRAIETTRGEEYRPAVGYLKFGDSNEPFPAFLSGEPGYDGSYHL